MINPIFDMCISSGDIRDQSRKFSEIAPKYGRFFALNTFLGEGAFRKLDPVYHCYIATRRLKKFRKDTASSPEVIEPNTLNFRPNQWRSQDLVSGGAQPDFPFLLSPPIFPLSLYVPSPLCPAIFLRHP